jgi:hypothetical protein
MFNGSTTNELGAKPKLHCIDAPLQTWFGIGLPRPFLRPFYTRTPSELSAENAPLL